MTSNASYSVRSYVCQELKASEKYRRHLNFLVRNGQINQTILEEIIFKSRYTRKDCQLKHGISIGNLCTFRVGETICGIFVKDLRVHLIKTHKLCPSDKDFILALENSSTCAKTIAFSALNIHRRIFDGINLSKLGIAPTSSTPVSSETHTLTSLPLSSNDDESIFF